MNLHAVSLPQLQPSPGNLVALCVLPSFTAEQPLLLALNTDAELWKIELLTGLTRQLATIQLSEWEPDHPVQLIVSPCGRFAGVSKRKGKYAVIVELTSGTTVLSLERGEYHYEQSFYPLAFIRHNEQVLLAHGTDWNRLDLTMLFPEVKLLSERPIPDSRGASDAEKAHYLDYFHGKLYASTDGSYIAETGWVWAPAGITRVWSSSEWLTNVWTTEDGASLESVWQPSVDWDLPMVWLNNELVAIWGQLDEDLLDKEDWGPEGTQATIIIYNAKLRTRHGIIPNIPDFASSPSMPPGFFDDAAQLAVSAMGKLFAWGRSIPVHVCDLSTLQLEYKHSDQNLQPDLYHTEADLFLKIGAGSIQAWRYE